MKLMLGLLSLALLIIALYYYLNSQELEQKTINLTTKIDELNKQIEEQSLQLNYEKENRAKLNNLLNQLNSNLSSLLKQYKNLEEKYNKTLNELNDLELKYNELLKNLSNRSEEKINWSIFINLSKWFRENEEFYDDNLRRDILRECSNGFTLRIPCASNFIRYKYGYNNNINEFDSVKMMFDRGYSDCKGHALALRALLKSLPDYMFLEGMKKVRIIDYDYFSYKINNETILKGYTSHLFDRIYNYDFVVVCFNYSINGHCGVLISPINISSYKDVKAGFVIDPMKGEVLGDVGNIFKICDDCLVKYKILMVISNNWIDYYTDEGWKRLQ